MLKLHWRSPGIRMATSIIVAGILWCVGVVYAAQGHPYEPYMLLLFSVGLVISGRGYLYFVQVVRYEHEVDEMIRKRKAQEGSIKLTRGWY